MQFKGLEISPFRGQKTTARDAEKWCRLSLDMPRMTRNAVTVEARRARCSTSELCRAIITDWIEHHGVPMTEALYMEELERSKYFMTCHDDGEYNEFWRGYYLGLHRAHDGVSFGTQEEHLARYADEFAFGEGYRTGLLCYRTGLRWEG